MNISTISTQEAKSYIRQLEKRTGNDSTVPVKSDAILGDMDFFMIRDHIRDLEIEVAFTVRNPQHATS